MRSSDIQVEKLNQFTGHKAAIFCLVASGDNDGFLTGAGDGVIAQWKFSDPSNAIALAQVPGNIFALAHLPEKKLIAAGDMNGGIYIIDTNTKSVIKNLSQNNKSIYDIYFDLKNERLIAAGGDGFVRCWEFENYNLISEIKLSENSIRNIATDPLRNLFSFASSDNNIYLTDKNFNIVEVLSGHLNSVFCSAFHPSENLVLSGSRDARLIVWNLENFSIEKNIEAHLFTINDIKFSPDGTLFATAGRDKHLKIWDAGNFELLKVIDREKYGGHINSVNKLFWNPIGNFLISCGDDRTAIQWKISQS